MTAPLEAGVDVETTGLERGDHRIIEIYIGLWRGDKLLRAFNQRIDPQRSIAKEAQDVHKISSADLVGMPVWQAIAPTVHAYLSKADVWVAHNGDDFDFPFIAYELKRVGLVMPEKPTIDTMHYTWATPDGKKPNLRELCLACDVPYDPTLAHAADYDVHRMMESLFNARRFGAVEPFTLPEQMQQAA
ncbi:DNA polymerase III epsilon subunit protein [Rhizobium phage RHph_N1_15]|nr:DNA polymerase III epsilon subunit protein [Rhizobium phage RHph_N1_15]QIG75191.1 DNA polymerase III epsilon subunit protein [Rhizobium phage RHph_N2_6]